MGRISCLNRGNQTIMNCLGKHRLRKNAIVTSHMYKTKHTSAKGELLMLFILKDKNSIRTEHKMGKDYI